MTRYPSRNTLISIVSLVVLGIAGLAALLFGLDKWLVGGAIVSNILETCDVVGQGCASGYSAVIQFIANPFQLLIAVVLTTLVFAVLKTALMIYGAHKIANRFDGTPDDYPSLISIMIDLGIDDTRVKISKDPKVVAFTYGVIRPVICISSGAIELLEPTTITALLAHELSHVKKRDNFSIVIAMFVRDFLWFLPISHYLLKIFMREKEYVADDYAAQLTGQPLAVADAIVSVAKALTVSRNLSPAYASFYSGESTAKARVSRLLSNEHSSKHSAKKLAVSIILSVLIVAAVSGIAYAQSQAILNNEKGCEMGDVCKQSNSDCCIKK